MLPPLLSALRGTLIDKVSKKQTLTSGQQQLLAELSAIDDAIKPNSQPEQEIRTGIVKQGGRPVWGPNPGVCNCCGK
jgi:hypothetical protein